MELAPGPEPAYDQCDLYSPDCDTPLLERPERQLLELDYPGDDLPGPGAEYPAQRPQVWARCNRGWSVYRR